MRLNDFISEIDLVKCILRIPLKHCKKPIAIKIIQAMVGDKIKVVSKIIKRKEMIKGKEFYDGEGVNCGHITKFLGIVRKYPIKKCSRCDGSHKLVDCPEMCRVCGQKCLDNRYLYFLYVSW